MKIVAVVQVRMGSSRLPGKPLMRVMNKPLLGYLLDRLGLCRQIDELVVATSTNPENDQIENFCTESGVHCFRGSENDVLGRMLGALNSRSATVGVEVFGDCPLIDPAIVDEMIHLFKCDSELDWIGNDLVTSFPPGMEVEVFKLSSLTDSASRTEDPTIREHGTLYLRQHPDLYKVRNVEAEGKLRRPELELELDTAEDLEVITSVLEFFGEDRSFGIADVIDFMDANPKLKKINSTVHRRWKYFREDSTVFGEKVD
jgi:spore coat polysaccharide biosynthesis protein SpsF (cytidylyltransferase family)